MLQVISAVQDTTSHGLPRTVTGKPMHVRCTWLLMFLLMSALFFKGFIEFVIKLQQRQVTTSLEADSLSFNFPDVYACFENPFSGSYAANIDAKSAQEVNAELDPTRIMLRRQIASLVSNADERVDMEIGLSFVYVQSLQYQLMVDQLAHRPEQDIISSDLTYTNENGLTEYKPLPASSFYHPLYLRCYRWSLNSTWQDKILRGGLSSGLVLTLMLDVSFPGMPSTGAPIEEAVFAKQTPIPVSDWSLSVGDFNTVDRRSGLRVFLAPPGEYPSEFVKSFSLSPGKHHTVEISMTQKVKKDGQFECKADASVVQFLNPYHQTPYDHTYSYSYCYYYEYHRQFQALVNLSGVISPLPWPLRGAKFTLNLTGEPTFFAFFRDSNLSARADLIANETIARCKSQQPCSTLDYTVSTSSADWPTQSSLPRFVSTSVKQIWVLAKERNLSVPALDFLVGSNASAQAAYAYNNLLKVHFKPHRLLSDKVTFSIDYGLQNFISDVGGIMGIYLGMSLLTLCEIVELMYDLLVYGCNKAEKSIKVTRSSIA